MAPQQHHTSRVGVAQGAPGLAHIMALPPAIPRMMIPLKCPMQHKIGTAAKTNYRLRCYKVQRSARRNNISLQRRMIPATRGHQSAVCPPNNTIELARSAPATTNPCVSVAQRAPELAHGASPRESTCREILLPLALPDVALYRQSSDNPRSTPAQRQGTLPARERLCT